MSTNEPPERLSAMKSVYACLLELLECPVCLETCHPPIYMCIRGHNVCSLCAANMSDCPICRADGLKSRNLAMEQLYTHVLLPCQFKPHGCQVELNISGLTLHQSVCDFRVLRQKCVPIVVNSYRWRKAMHGEIFDEAVKVGTDKDGGSLYVGRAAHGNDVIPAKIAPSHGCAFVSWGGREHRKLQYDVLCTSMAQMWQSAHGGEVPTDSVMAGHSADIEPLYVGRVFHDGCVASGKIHPSHGCCYVPYGGEELPFYEYEALTLVPSRS